MTPKARALLERLKKGQIADADLTHPERKIMRSIMLRDLAVPVQNRQGKPAWVYPKEESDL